MAQLAAVGLQVRSQVEALSPAFTASGSRFVSDEIPETARRRRVVADRGWSRWPRAPWVTVARRYHRPRPLATPVAVAVFVDSGG